MTTTRIIQREFVIQPLVPGLIPVTAGTWSSLPLQQAAINWSSFMNTFAGWTNTTRHPGADHGGAVEPDSHADGQSLRQYREIFLPKGNYYVLAAADNRGTLKVNGQNISLYQWYDNISRTSTANSTVIYHPGGTMTLEYKVIGSLRWVHSAVYFTKFVSSQGIAITISEYKQEVIPTYSAPLGTPNREFVRNTLGPPYVGEVVWNTRQGTIGSAGRYQITMPFRANITAHAWGAGAGSGGLDNTEGGIGSPGLYNTASFEVERGDIVQVFVGSGGLPAAPTVKRQGSTRGGEGGLSIININSDPTKSFNGGRGGRAGPAGWSGAGGGGGGASGVLVNGIPAIVAGGGGGGGGGGAGRATNPNSTSNGRITNNATGDYSIGVPALDVDNSGSLTLSAQTQIVEYYTLPSMTAPPRAAGSTKVFAFGYGFNAAGSFTRTVQTNNKVNLSTSGVLTFFARRGSLQAPEPGEDLRLEYSINGSTWTNITSVPVNVIADTWLVRSPQIPAGAKVAGGVFLRYRQTVTGGSNFTNKDLWAVTSIFNGSPTLDFRGESGSSKGVNEGGADGGGGGGGGGGYPGGQGGGTPGGDVPGFAGQCGGNFPDNTGATTGTDSPYYKKGYAGGSLPPNGTGQNGRVFLEIEPLSLMSVKVSNEWKQINEVFVKVSGTWRDIGAVYVKIDDVWREINGAGQIDIVFSGNNQNYGTSTRSFS